MKDDFDSLSCADVFSLRGKRVVLTGAAGEIGSAIASVFAQNGASLYLTDIREAQLQEAQNACLANSNTNVRAHAADQASTNDMKAVVDGALAFFDGRVDCVIHCGGITWSRPLLDDPDVSFDIQFQTNVRSFWHLMRGFVPAMRQHGGGSVIAISSVHGHRAEGACTLYTACKAALMAMVVELSGEFGADNIRVNSVSPGWILSSMPKRHWSHVFIKPEHQAEVKARLIDVENNHILQTQTLPRLGRPEDVALACLYLASDAARFITGTDLLVDGGKLHMQPDSPAGHEQVRKRLAARETARGIARALPQDWWINERRPIWF